MNTQTIIQSKTRVCGNCGISFEVIPHTEEIAGQIFTFPQKHCDSCVADFDKRKEAASKGGNRPARPDWSSFCPPSYQGFQMDKLPPEGRKKAEDVLSWKPGPKGIGLKGQSSTGKTFLLTELFRRWYQNGSSVCITTSTEFAWACGSADQTERRELMSRMFKADMVFLDDVGKERMTDRVESDLYYVFEERKRNLLPIFVTLNSTGDDLAKNMSQDRAMPIINRLKDTCEFITVK